MPVQGRFVVGADHPSLPGHFPGDPIVPAAVFLDYAIEFVRNNTGRRVTGISAAKFNLPVMAEKTCILSMQVKGDRASVSASIDGEIAFSFTAELDIEATHGG
jgi:3-hydroxymyristoyl/3-hydroxydecanoyl-(acyl carrier protein) dehydratase